jgi:hypothetical protein
MFPFALDRETQAPTNISGTFKLPSDANFAVDPSTKKEFSRFIANQDNWYVSHSILHLHPRLILSFPRAHEYADAHFKMSLLGQDQASMTDCTEILPSFIDITKLEVPGTPSQDPVVNGAELEQAIENQRSIWLN